MTAPACVFGKSADTRAIGSVTSSHVTYPADQYGDLHSDEESGFGSAGSDRSSPADGLSERTALCAIKQEIEYPFEQYHCSGGATASAAQTGSGAVVEWQFAANPQVAQESPPCLINYPPQSPPTMDADEVTTILAMIGQTSPSREDSCAVQMIHQGANADIKAETPGFQGNAPSCAYGLDFGSGVYYESPQNYAYVPQFENNANTMASLYQPEREFHYSNAYQ